MEKKDFKLLQEITFADLQTIEDEVIANDRAATELLVHPRTFFRERGYLLPAAAEITITPTEERKARLYNKEGRSRYFTDLGNPQCGTIKIHVIDGYAKCSRVEIDCPAQRVAPVKPEGGKDIFTQLSLQEFYAIVTEAEKSDELTDALIKDTRGYFEKKGYYASPEVRFRSFHTTKWIDKLSDEFLVDKYLEEEPAFAKVYHISSGRGKCTHIEVTCDCKN